ncbi:hypothetical protein BREVNS_2272 [Brevinematales bacterium NS]|nr:Crp/Fnr family transcriptional regulator [Brevinematales bacterium]QJR23022.1 hypothetical protein BREVNS_2272 [Brevinematales bacterium NS]
MFFPWHLSLFEDLSSEEREMLLRLPWKEKHFKKGEILFLEGSPYTSLWILTGGECRAIFSSFSYSQEPLVVEILKSPVVLAPAILFASYSYFPVTVEALTEGKLLWVEKVLWENCLTRCEKLMRNFLRDISDKLVILSRRMILLQLPVQSRVLSFLVHTYKGEEKIILPMSIEQVATYLGMARQVLCRIFRKLEMEGYLTQTRRTIILKKRFFDEYIRTSKKIVP